LPKTKTEDRTVTRSFRISEQALESIESEAKRQNINVSTIINQQLLAYSEFERYFLRLGLIKISSATFARLLLASSDAEIEKAGTEAGSDTPRSIILAKYGVMSLETVIDYLKMLSEFANQYEFGQVEQGGKLIVTLLHGLGPKGSLFFTSYVRALFDSINYSPKISASAHSVGLEISPEKSQTSSY
jgi:hypothetical protein